MSTNTKMAEALQDGLSVCNSVSMAAGRRVVIDGCVLYAQTEEWCQWAKKEVRPRLQTALNAHDAEQAAKAVPADPCVVLWQAMNEAEKVGNRTDDKLIVKFLREAGYGIAPIAAHDAEQAQEPVAWRVWRGDSYELFFNEEAAKRRCECFIRKGKPEPLYAAPVEQAAQAVPDGFVLVPEEPTLEMLTAAGREDDKAFIDGMPHGATAADTWTAMLDAAPTPPAPEAQQPAGQEQDERDAFEAWATEYSTIPLERDDDDGLGTTGYTVMEQTMLWDAWQAAMTRASAAVEAVAVQMPRPASWSGAVTPERVEQMLADYRAAVLRALGGK